MAKLVRRIFVLLFFLAALAGTASAQKKLTASEAKEHFGEVATVCGDVVSARYANTSRGEPTFLNLDRAYPNQIFTVVIWGNNRSKFGIPEETYKGKHICVSGKITAYDGLPEIVAEDSQQIKLDGR
ncbi:MAG TPA: DNA-binding protein [Candidatus Angelobacter sp.]|nr:DNA-binding protein [Candidatus Angelobacter sp.]